MRGMCLVLAPAASKAFRTATKSHTLCGLGRRLLTIVGRAKSSAKGHTSSQPLSARERSERDCSFSEQLAGMLEVYTWAGRRSAARACVRRRQRLRRGTRRPFACWSGQEGRPPAATSVAGTLTLHHRSSCRSSAASAVAVAAHAASAAPPLPFQPQVPLPLLLLLLLLRLNSLLWLGLTFQPIMKKPIMLTSRTVPEEAKMRTPGGENRSPNEV